MALRQVYIDGIGEVTLAKRRGNRNLRLSINANGRVRVGLPQWVSYRAAIKFANDRKDWIARQLVVNEKALLLKGMRIGKSHTIYFNYDPHARTVRIRIDKIGIYVTSPHDEQDERVQVKTRAASEKALLSEAVVILPQRVQSLAKLHGYFYSDLRIRKLTSRWGSCSTQKVIVLSYYLMQMPWDHIDYVILHELVHTRHPNHSHKFWAELDKLVPNARAMQKTIRVHSPRVQPL